MKVSTSQTVVETVNYDHNLQNRLKRAITSYNDGQYDVNEVTEYTYNDQGIRVKSY